jgi:hypothetical protein
MRVKENAKPSKNRKLLIETVAAIRDLAEQGLSHAKISKRYNVSPSHVGSIVRREVYKEIP